MRCWGKLASLRRFSKLDGDCSGVRSNVVTLHNRIDYQVPKEPPWFRRSKQQRFLSHCYRVERRDQGGRSEMDANLGVFISAGQCQRHHLSSGQVNIPSQHLIIHDLYSVQCHAANTLAYNFADERFSDYDRPQ